MIIAERRRNLLNDFKPLITPEFLKKYRKHALVVVLILAAIITPPDVASQVIVAIPILILYEISIKVAAIVIKRQEKNAK